MAARTKVAAEPAERVLLIKRVFDAPRELVFKCWTEREHVIHWMAPKGFTIHSSQADLRPGGAWSASMRPPQGPDLRLQGVYREIVPPERLVFTHTWLDQKGKPGHETLITVTFAERRGKTELTFRQAVFASVAERDGHEGGWNECLDLLAEYLAGQRRGIVATADQAVSKPVQKAATTLTLPSDREIVLTRVFDTPRRLVFEAHSSPKHLKHWWGPRRYTMVTCEMDFRAGGAWRFVQRGLNGQEYGFRGVYREIVAPERIVQTFEFDGMPGQVSVETLTLVEKDGTTTLTSRSVFPTTEARDAMIRSGMESGAAETMDRLAEYLSTMTSVRL